MSKKKREGNLIVRMSEDELAELENFAHLWEQEYGVSLTKSKIMRLALDEFMSKYDFNECIADGNVIETRLDPQLCDIHNLYEIAEEVKSTKNLQSEPGRYYVFQQIQKFLEEGARIERNARHLQYSFGFRKASQFYQTLFKQEGRLLANFWSFKEGQK